MVPAEFQELSRRRAARARTLAARYPAARDPLTFFAQIVAFQAQLDPRAPLAGRPALVALVRRVAPAPLAALADSLDEAACREALAAYRERRDLESPRSFFARVLLQPGAAIERPRGPDRSDRTCPRCGHPPQVGCLRPAGHGLALSLICSLCLAEWPFARATCASCGETREQRLAYYAAGEIDHLRVQACETCRRYLHTVDLSKAPDAVPDADEVAALPLDVWAHEQRLSKVQPNLIGI